MAVAARVMRRNRTAAAVAPPRVCREYKSPAFGPTLLMARKLANRTAAATALACVAPQEPEECLPAARQAQAPSAGIRRRAAARQAKAAKLVAARPAPVAKRAR